MRIRCPWGRARRLTHRDRHKPLDILIGCTHGDVHTNANMLTGIRAQMQMCSRDTHAYVNLLTGPSTHMQMHSQPSPGDKCAHGNAQTMNCCLHICSPHLSPVRYPQFLTPKSLAPTQPPLSFLLISTPDTNPLLRGGDREGLAQLGGVHLPSHGLQPCMQLRGGPSFLPFSPQLCSNHT